MIDPIFIKKHAQHVESLERALIFINHDFGYFSERDRWVRHQSRQVSGLGKYRAPAQSS